MLHVQDVVRRTMNSMSWQSFFLCLPPLLASWTRHQSSGWPLAILSYGTSPATEIHLGTVSRTTSPQRVCHSVYASSRMCRASGNLCSTFIAALQSGMYMTVRQMREGKTVTTVRQMREGKTEHMLGCNCTLGCNESPVGSWGYCRYNAVWLYPAPISAYSSQS